MGRLRNLSASFKAAAFPSASNHSSSTYNRASPDSTDRLQGKDAPTIVREASSNSIAESSNAARPTSMIYTPPTIGSMAAGGEVEELKPVFSFLSSHANKLYQEGYFLKLDDLDTNGKPNANRVWTECFAQLVGTILSFWNAEALDAAGQDGEVAPSFINLSDASIKMIETLPTRNQDVQPLQNVLSVSTAGKNRYLLHFNSLHSLTQWTAGIRLAMFENASLQELYTGSLIAGKGRHLNSINQIMTKSKFRIEDWARVRFGAGTPWRRCWCVIEPPDEKEWQKSQKRMGKRSAYEKTIFPKGDIKFYDTKKTKKALPIATITDAYSAYAVYPQSKALINESTLVKLEGKITIHSQPESKTEGFVFVMPEVHPAVSGFEMLLRWLLPVYDTFALYGRPTRLIPDTMDTKSLMFAMPKERRYGYLDIIDIATLIHTDGSDRWSEREWRKKMKEAVLRRLSMQNQGRASNLETVRDTNNARPAIHFSDDASTHSVRSAHKHNMSTDAVFEPPKMANTAPARLRDNHHIRSASENITLSPKKRRDPTTREYRPSRLSEEPSPQDHGFPPIEQQRHPLRQRINDAGYADSANSSDSEIQGHIYAEDVEHDMIQTKLVQPVATPPDFQHQPNEQPRRRPADRPEMRREKSRMSDATLSQMNPRALDELRREEAARSQNVHNEHNVQGGAAASAAAYAWNQNRQGSNGFQAPGLNGHALDQGQSRGVITETNMNDGILANTPRPAVVTSQSSSSIPSSVRRKPLPSAADPTNKSLDRLPLRRTHSNTSNYSMPAPDRDSSPDYASRPSDEKPREGPRERIRGGTRKVVGDATDKQDEADNLHIDFGQTLRLTPESGSQQSRPSTAGGRRSPFDSLGGPASASGRRSPFDSLGQPSGRKSPLNPFESPQRTPERQSPRERPSHSRSQSYAWQPGSHVQEDRSGLTAEEFVAQRYAMANKPQGYVPHRTHSSGRIDQIRAEETSQRPAPSTSPKRLQKRTSLARNTSSPSVDYSAHLSAREQEHVAKMTGGPLLSNVNQKPPAPDPNVGLIGAIEAREQERRDIKEGLQGRMVQAAIDQRTRESRMAAHQRGQSQYQQYMQPQAPQQYQYPQYPAQAEYQPQQFPPQPAYWYAQQQEPPAQSVQNYQQSMYSMQSAQSQYLGEMQRQPGNAPRQPHQRSQSSYSQYGGFYAPQGR